MCQFKNMFSSISLLCCYLVLLRITSYGSWVIDDEGCRTPDQGVGDCKKAKDCKPLTDFLLSISGPISQEIKSELAKYRCGFSKGSIKVCCPSGPIVLNISQDLVLPDTSPPPPPDVTKHRNLKLLPTECGYLGNPDKIREGEAAKLNEFPWMALLSYKIKSGRKEFKCGGTIINNRYILTAAHCLSNLQDPIESVRVGEHKISTTQDCEILESGKKICSAPVQDVNIEEVIVHPKYNRSFINNDIGLLRVAEINLNAGNVKPICLPTTEDIIKAKFKYCVVTGWGFTDEYGYEKADVLQKVDLPIMNLTQCREVYKGVPQVSISHYKICAGGKSNKDSCRGDSGGPMQVASFLNNEIRYVQHGVVSFGHKLCGTEGYPGVYTRVAYYMDWILDSIKP